MARDIGVWRSQPYPPLESRPGSRAGAAKSRLRGGTKAPTSVPDLLECAGWTGSANATGDANERGSNWSGVGKQGQAIGPRDGEVERMFGMGVDGIDGVKAGEEANCCARNSDALTISAVMNENVNTTGSASSHANPTDNDPASLLQPYLQHPASSPAPSSVSPLLLPSPQVPSSLQTGLETGTQRSDADADAGEGGDREKVLLARVMGHVESIGRDCGALRGLLRGVVVGESDGWEVDGEGVSEEGGDGDGNGDEEEGGEREGDDCALKF